MTRCIYGRLRSMVVYGGRRVKIWAAKRQVDPGTPRMDTFSQPSYFRFCWDVSHGCQATPLEASVSFLWVVGCQMLWIC